MTLELDARGFYLLIARQRDQGIWRESLCRQHLSQRLKELTSPSPHSALKLLGITLHKFALEAVHGSIAEEAQRGGICDVCAGRPQPDKPSPCDCVPHSPEVDRAIRNLTKKKGLPQ